MMGKIGVGLLTCQPRSSFARAFDFQHHMVDHVVVVNDGEEFKENWNSGFRSLHVSKDPETTLVYYQNPINLGVAKSKNLALKHLLDLGCDHIFLMEDDIYIKDNSVFQRYIEASKISGIQHFNFSQHGLMNKTHHGRSLPNPLTFIDYGSIKIPLYLHCVGAFSYYSRKCLETVGLMDENYYNACEHVDHTYEIIKAGMHPPFWNFADIENSWQYLGDEPWSLEQSTISSKSNHREIVAAADKVFMAKHGHLPRATPMTTEEGLVNSLKELKKNYGK